MSVLNASDSMDMWILTAQTRILSLTLILLLESPATLMVRGIFLYFMLEMHPAKPCVKCPFQGWVESTHSVAWGPLLGFILTGT